MTIVLSVKVNEGVVVAADSAATLSGPVPGVANTLQVTNVYTHANKIIHLHKDLPLGLATWGAGSIGQESVYTLSKDLRQDLMGQETKAALSVSEAAQQVRDYFFEQKYQQLYGQQPPELQPPLGILVFGYSPGQPLAEEWLVEIQPGGHCPPPQPIRKLGEAGLSWHGEQEAIHRLVWGYSQALHEVLDTVALEPEAQQAIVAGLQQRAHVNYLVHPAMPIQDAIDLAEFLVHLTIMYARFVPGPPIVAAPIEIATITKHEGFRWIRRKFYFDQQYNP
ncbi:MAG: hypothetical protein HC915_19440 [Anaerolineae bacterium]|nr:hypothetical protein [Anaerolineae bacterium]